MAALELWSGPRHGPGGHARRGVAHDRVRSGIGEPGVGRSGSVEGARPPRPVRIDVAVLDLGSRNGTHLNGKRLTGQRRLRDPNQILTGRTRLVYRDRADAHRPPTDVLEPPPRTSPGWS